MRKVRYIAQIQQTECGLCVIAMILNYYNAHYSLYDIRQSVQVGRDGISAANLLEILGKFGMDTQAYRCSDINVLQKLTVPFIVMTEEKHYSIVEKVTQKAVYVVDPEIGNLKYSYSEFLEIFNGICILAEPGEKFQRKKKEYRVLKDMYPLLEEKKIQYLIFTILSGFQYLVMIALPMSIQKLVDGVFNKKSLSNLVMVIFLVSVLYIISSLFLKFNITKLKVDVDKKINKKVFGHMVKLPYFFFETRRKADIIYTLNHITDAKDVLVTDFLSLVLNIGVLIVIWIYFFFSNKVLVLALNIALIPNIILAAVSQKVVTGNMRRLVIENSRVQGYQTEVLYSMFDIKAGARENHVLCEWQKKYDKYSNKYGKSEKASAIWSTVLSISQTLSPIFVLTVGILLSKDGLITMGEIIALFSLAEIFFGQVYGVFDSILSIGLNYIYIERLGDILFVPETEASKAGTRMIECINTIAVQNLSFQYTEQSNYILRDITFKVNSGEVAAIVGQSGSGKSTLIKIISGLYKASEGKVLINGMDMANIRKECIAPIIGVVPQDSCLYNKTIHENLTQGNDNITEKELLEILKLVNVYDEIMEMPMGLNTLISEMGLNLSGGQRQRIVIARELLKHPSLLLLDEATSALDFANESGILERISKLNITVIIITHRLSSIKNADKILFIDKGRIAEQGTHEELLKMGGLYHAAYCRDKE